MGIFSVVIDELESALNAVLKQVDVAQQAKNGIQQAMGALVGQTWQGDGARAFEKECAEEVIAVAESILGFSDEYTKGITNTINFLRQLDEALSNPIGAIGSIFGF